MMTPLDLDHLLQKFSGRLPHHLALPAGVAIDQIQSIVGEILEEPFIKLHVLSDHPRKELPHAPFHFYFKAEPIETPFILSFHEPAAAYLLSRFFNNSDPFSDLRLKKGALGYSFLKALSIFDTHKLFQKLSLVLTDSIDPHEAMHAIKVELVKENFPPIIFELLFPEGFVHAYLDLYKHQLHAPSSKALYQIQVMTGSTHLKKSQLKQIQKNQLVLLDEHYYHTDTQKGMGRLFVENRPFAQVRITPNTLKILDFNPLPEEVFMDESIDETNPSILHTIDEVPLELMVEFATLKVELSQLEALKAGQTLDIHKENPTCVYLSLHGQRIAKGELVQVGEKMAFLVQETRHG